VSAFSFARAAHEAPECVAVVVGGRLLRYGELAEPVARACASLANWDADDVAVLTPGLRLESLVQLWACMERGVPMLLLHPRLTRAERAAALRYANDALGREPRAWPKIMNDASSPPVARVPALSRPLAYVFTSGTTSAPRAAILSRQAFLAASQASEDNLGWLDQDRWLLSLSPAHVGGLGVLVRCLLARRAVVLPDDERFRAEALASQLSRDAVTLVSLVPTMVSRLLEHDPAWRSPDCLRAALVGGAACSPPLLRSAHARGLPTLTTYGMTETCGQVATQPYAERGQLSSGVGRALSGVRLRIHGARIEVSADSTMHGYLGVAPDAQPFAHDGWLQTSDAGSLTGEGTLRVHGRLDDVIVSGGENVAPAEVEQALEALPGVERAFVFGQPHAEWGECVCAALVLDGAAPALSDMAVGLRERLAAHKLPRRVTVLDSLPLTPKGSVHRTHAIQLALQSGLVSWPQHVS